MTQLESRHALDFALLGAPKCGTTSVADALDSTPGVSIIQPKDAHVWLRAATPVNPVSPYEQRIILPRYEFAASTYEAELASLPTGNLAGEAGVFYMHDPLCTIANGLREGGRVIVMLRRPDDRAYSAYSHLKRDGWEDLDFEDALAAEESRVSEGRDPLWQYRALSMYADALERLYDQFGRQRVWVGLYEELANSPDELARSLGSFLDVQMTNSSIPVSNRGGSPRSSTMQRFMNRPSGFKEILKAPIPRRTRAKIRRVAVRANLRPYDAMRPETRKRLLADFSADIARTAKLIGRDLTHWRDAP